VTVRLDGGELEVEVGDELDVTLTGWAEPVFAGEFSEEFLAELERAA
jgi:diaminopimelate epimerase